ncbi:MAG: hypothetical protein JO148_00540 [Acidimicrobiia bacterium]|nr:hypothetical protein [Acidimicrobiia bacterium]
MAMFSMRKRAATAAVAALTAGLAVSSLLTGGAAHADPIQLTSPFVGVGSDTIQSVNDAFSGFVAGSGITNNYSALQASPGPFQMTSWDATGSSCITPKAPGASFVRPNGSGAGQKALGREIDGSVWGVSGDACGGPKSVAGLIDYGRSSAGPGAACNQANCETFIPFARDGVSFAYQGEGTAATSPVTSLSQAQLQSIYSDTGSGTTVGGTLIIPCGIQLGSGTYKFWLGITNGGNAAPEATATTLCNSVNPTNIPNTTNGRIEENTGVDLQQKATSLANCNTSGTNPCAGAGITAPPNGGNFEVIEAHSAASYAAQGNGRAPDLRGSTPVGLGSITGLGAPLSGSAGSFAPNSGFYNDTTFGRYVFHILDTARVTGLGNAALKAMFVGSSSQICTTGASTTQLFGFLPLPTTGSGTGVCGDTSQTQNLPTGAS